MIPAVSPKRTDPLPPLPAPCAPSPSASHGVCRRSALCFPHFWTLDELTVAADGSAHLAKYERCQRTPALATRRWARPRRGPLLPPPPPPQPMTAAFPSLILEMKSRCGLQDSPWAKEGEVQEGFWQWGHSQKGQREADGAWLKA